MIRSEGILTSAGGTNSHAAVVAEARASRPWLAADQVRVDRQGRKFTAGGTEVAEGDWVTIDGFTGKVYAGQLELADSPIERARAGDPRPAGEDLAGATSASWPGPTRSGGSRCGPMPTPLGSRPTPSSQGRGIGLCRTEHMFLGEERVAAVRRMVFADSEAEQAAYDTLLPLSATTSSASSSHGRKPVTVRLLDPPLHEFLPDQVDLAVAVALAKAGADDGGGRLRRGPAAG